MEHLLSFVESYRLYLVGVFLFLGFFFVALYFDIFSKLPLKKVRREKDIRKYLEDYLDEDGRVLIEKLSKVWSDENQEYSYSRKEVERLLNQTANFTERELVARAERILGNAESTDSSKFFDSLPVEEKISALFGEGFLDNVLKNAGGDISKVSRTVLAEKLWGVIESYSNNRKLSELSKEDLAEIANTVKGEFGGSDLSISSNKASDIANEVSKEVVHPQSEEDISVISKLGSEGDEPEELSIDENFKGNLPEEIRKRLMDLGVPSFIVDRIYFQSNEYIKLQHLFEYLWHKPVEDIIKFYTSLYLSKDLKYFLNHAYEPVKLFKDFLVFVLNNYVQADVKSSISRVFSKAFNSADFYAYLNLKNPQAYKQKRSENPAFFTFLGIFVAYESGFSSEFQDIYVKFIERTVKYLNVKNEGLAYRVYRVGKKDQEEEFTASYDHLGFTFKEDIYLIPKALDIIFGKYFLALPYILRKDVEINFSPSYPAHTSRYLLKFQQGESKDERIEVLTKLKRNSVLYSSIMRNLVNKQNKITNYIGLYEVSKI